LTSLVVLVFLVFPMVFYIFKGTCDSLLKGGNDIQHGATQIFSF
jgi:hypothetical protein